MASQHLDLDPQQDCSEHAADVRAQFEGKNTVELAGRSYGNRCVPLPLPHRPVHVATNPNWEVRRPIEVDTAPSPWIGFSPGWDRRHGRLVGLRGFSALGLALVRARQAF